MELLLEVCAGSLASALAARAGGADRIELCDNLAEGGTTPSPGIIRQAVKLLDIPVFVLIRPRTGDFLYSEEEFEAMKEDILYCKEQGVKGVVLGILNPDGSIDMERTGELARLAFPMEVTFHRAFDMTHDPFQSLEDIIKLGAKRILTSGQAATALEGAWLIGELIKKAGDQIIIMPGGGITEANVKDLIKTSGATEYHGSLRSKNHSKMIFQKTETSMGKADTDEFTWMETDPGRVKKVVEILNLSSKINS